MRFKEMKNKIRIADDPAELIRLAETELREWTEVYDEAKQEIKLWKSFLNKLNK